MKRSQSSNPRLPVGRWLLPLACLLLVVLLAGCGESPAAADGPIVASGFIEGDEVVIASETSGQIVEMFVERGDVVEAGDGLVRLDDVLLQSQRLEAEAGLTGARANLAHVLAGSRPEEIAAAQAALARAEAERDGAAQAVVNATEAISSPISLDAEIDAAYTQARLTEQSVEMAEANLAEIQMRRDVYADQGGDQAQLHGAETQYGLSEAQVDAARAKLDELEAGPTEEQVAMAEAQVRQAEAAVRLIDVQIERLALSAPIDGVVTSRSAQVGETTTAGSPLLTIASLDEVTLVIYIPENRIGQVQLNQEVEVQVDSFPERVFVGRVTNIANEAEFTPRNVQTQEERVNLVFAVKVSIPNPDYHLKPGMPADATIRP
jgi:HlyD family secretion protein